MSLIKNCKKNENEKKMTFVVTKLFIKSKLTLMRLIWYENVFDGKMSW